MKYKTLIALTIISSFLFLIITVTILLSSHDEYKTPNSLNKFHNCGILYETITSFTVKKATGGCFSSPLQRNHSYVIINAQFANGNSMEFLANSQKINANMVLGKEYIFYIKKMWIYCEDNTYLNLEDKPTSQYYGYCG